MRLLAWTPIVVGAEELARRQARYDRLSPAHVEIVLRDLADFAPSAPRALETDHDVRTSEDAVMWAFRASDAEGFDAFLPDCVLDPAIDAQGIARPVLGLSHLTATFLAAQGATVGALARNRAIADELDRRLASYSVKREQTLVMDLSFEDIADDETWRRAVVTHAGRLTCDFALNACSAVELGSPSTDTVVVDPTALALRLLGLRVELAGTAA
jgi:Asp/Glu/hydantoin racemase